MIIKFEYKIVEAIFERIFIFLVNTVQIVDFIFESYSLSLRLTISIYRNITFNLDRDFPHNRN